MDFYAFPLFLLWSGDRGKLQKHLKNLDVYTFSIYFRYFFGTSRAESVGSAGIIENKWISIHFHYLFGGAESVGNSRIIENIWISVHFHYFFGGTESVGSSRIIENRFLIYFHYFFSGAESVGSSGIIENI